MRIRSTFTPAKRTRASLVTIAALAAAAAIVAAPLSAAAAPAPSGDRPFGDRGQSESAPVKPGISHLGTSDGGSWEWARVEGANRYEVAVNLYSPFDSAEVVYIANGEKYPDALSAGPAAVSQNAGLLLTAQNSLPDVTREEIKRLHPSKLVVVGGEASVSAGVYDQLAALQPDITRIGGADRYEVSRNIIDYAFGETGVSTVFVATGNNFPDALAAGPAAAHLGGAVLLVNGWGDDLSEPTRQLLSDVNAQSARIAGGLNSVNDKVEADLRGAVASVSRYDGADRFEVAANINTSVWPGKTENAFIASGLVFPDALSSGPVAAYFDAPLFLTATTCYPAATVHAIWNSALNADFLLYVGGPNTLSQQLIDDPRYC
ncbi:cell wall-binding repeat-containing protein [Herbiconiux sp. P17]|uniref:cell wall-binding repeat-containing protein n=1 Tax=Herbiconiux wuyangfengii TaxID=3342794 RepID=UPI0035B8F980